jgi:hypothetical protein
LAGLNARVRRLEQARAAASTVMVVPIDRALSREEMAAEAGAAQQRQPPGWRGHIVFLPAMQQADEWEAAAAAWAAEHRPAEARASLMAAPPLPALPAPELTPPAPARQQGLGAVVIRVPLPPSSFRN